MQPPHIPPVEPAEELLDQVVPEPERPRAGRRWLRLGAALAVVGGVASVWSFTPLAEWLSPERLTALAAPIRDSGWGGPATVAIFVVAGVVAAPITGLLVACGVIFGAEGVAWGGAGTLASATTVYAMGRVASARWVDRLSHGGAQVLGQRLGRGGFLAVAGVRFVPVAPFSVVNLVAGAVRLPFGDFVVGTILGMAPIVVGLTLFGEGLIAAFAHPHAQDVALMAGVVLSLLGFGWWLRRHLLRRRGRLEARRVVDGTAEASKKDEAAQRAPA